jgi:CxxC motif-containing protein
MEKRELTCIQCPMGCALSVTIDENKIEVTGNSCPRGAKYGAKEVTDPTRIVTSTVPVHHGEISRVSVKTEKDIPKDRIFAVMDEIRDVTVDAPVHIGDVVLSNVAGTGVNIVATKDVAGIIPKQNL